MEPMPITFKRFTVCLLTGLILLISLPAVGGHNQPAGTNDAPTAVSGADKQPGPSDGTYSIQVGAFQEMDAVVRAMSQIAEADGKPFYRYEDTRRKGMWYRVYTGRYKTQQAALKAAEQLQQQGAIDAFMIRRLEQDGDAPITVDHQPAAPVPVARQPVEKPSPDATRPADVMENKLRPWALDAHDIGFQKRMQASAMADGGDRHGSASASTPVRLSLLDAIRYGLEGNREISVDAYTPKQAQADITGAEAAYDPLLFADATLRRDPNLQSSITDIVTEDDGRIQAGIRQPLKTGGSLSTYLETRYGNLNNAPLSRRYKYIVAPTVELRQPLLNNIGSKKEQTAIRIANYQATLSEEAFRQKVIEISNRVASVYWRLFLSRALIAINRQNLTMAEEVYRREDVRLAKGISQQLDVERARSDVHSRRSSLLQAQEAYRLAMDRLKLLVNGAGLTIDSNAEVIPVETPQTAAITIDARQVIQTALLQRPEIVKAQQEVNIRHADEALSAHQRLPSLDAIGRYSFSGYGESFERAGDDMSINDENAWEVGLYFEWPMGNRAANSRHRKKTLKRLQADAQLERLKDDVRLDVKQVLHAIETAKGEIDATRLAMEAAEKVVQGEFARFDIGQTSNLELLRAQDLLATTSRSYVRALVDYNIALNELMRVQGMLPPGVALATARR